MELSSLSAGCGPSFSITCRVAQHSSASGGGTGPPAPLPLPYLAQDEGHHVRGLPVAGVEEVGQGDGGEGGQRVGAVQRVVDALRAPPALQDCQESSHESIPGPYSTPCSPAPFHAPHRTSGHPDASCPVAVPGGGGQGVTLTLDNFAGAGGRGGLSRLAAPPEAPEAAGGSGGSGQVHLGQEEGRVHLQGLRCGQHRVRPPRAPLGTPLENPGPSGQRGRSPSREEVPSPSGYFW